MRLGREKTSYYCDVVSQVVMLLAKFAYTVYTYVLLRYEV